MDRPLAAYVFVYLLVTVGSWGLGECKRAYYTNAISAGITLVVAWIIAFFLLQARKRTARSLTPNQLQDFVVGSVLIYGGMKLSGLLYLTAQGYKFLQEDAGGCSATTVPVLSISFMILMVLVYRLAILPLATAPTTRSQVGSFKNITMKNRASMLGVLVAGGGNIFLFSSIKDGWLEKPMLYLTLVVLIAIVFVMLLELIAIIRYQSVRRRQTIAVESGAAPPPPPPPPRAEKTTTQKTCSMPWRAGGSSKAAWVTLGKIRIHVYRRLDVQLDFHCIYHLIGIHVSS